MSHPRTSPAILAMLLALGAPLGAADAHAGHDHAAAADAHGKAAAIGTVDIGARSVAVTAAGAIAAGAEWHVELLLKPGQPAPKAIRVWVGVENGRGSAKARAEAEQDAPGEYAAHVEVPSPLPAESRLWIAIEGDDGQTGRGSLALPATAHAEGDGHRH